MPFFLFSSLKTAPSLPGALLATEVTSQDRWASKHSVMHESQAHSWLRSFNPSFTSDKASTAIEVTARPFSHVVWAENRAAQGSLSYQLCRTGWNLGSVVQAGSLEPCVYEVGIFVRKCHASHLVFLFSFTHHCPCLARVRNGWAILCSRSFKGPEGWACPSLPPVPPEDGLWWPSV